MKKILSIILAFSFVVQPAYTAFTPIKTVKKKFSAMKEVVRRGNATLKANWQCFTTGKGPNCNPDRRNALQVIRNFVTGKTQAAKEGLKKLVQAHKECWIPVLAMLVAAGVVTVGSLEVLFEGMPFAMATFVGGSAVTVAGLGAPVGFVYLLDAMDHGLVIDWKKVGKCMLVIGIDLPILIALVLVIHRMTYKLATSKALIDQTTIALGTILHAAVRWGNLARVKDLIEKGASVNAKSPAGYTPLHIAALWGRKAIMAELIKANSDVNARNNSNLTPIMVLLVSSPLFSDPSDPRPLSEAGPMAELLIDNGADLTVKDKEGNTPLHLAVLRQMNSTVKKLIQKGAEINAKNNDGDTPLHLAAQKGFKDIVRALITGGASAAAKNRKGQMPSQMTTDPAIQKELAGWQVVSH